VRALEAMPAPPPSTPTVLGASPWTLPAAAGGPTALDTLRQMSYVQATAWVIERLAQALQHAHRRSVIHRDIKPSNVLLCADGQPMLLDFNVSEHTDGEQVKAILGGTVAYMSPEHLQAMTTRGSDRAIRADHRADIYSLGMVLYEMLAGARPF